MSMDMFDFTAKRARLGPDRIAFEDLISGEIVSYGAFEDRCARAASVLGSFGVGTGDRVAVLCRNRIEFFELMFACAKTGALFVPLNWRMPAAELSGLLADCTPSLLVYGEEDQGAAESLIQGGCAALALDSPSAGRYADLRDAAAPHYGRTEWRADDIWYLLYTSGTTGHPKAVIQTYGMALVNYVNVRQAIDLRTDDTTVNFLPLFHTAGINLYTLPTLIAGGKTLVLPGFDPEHTIRLLASGSLDTFFGVPAVYQALSLHPQFDSVDLSRVRSWGCGGAPLPDVLVERFAERGAKVCNGYGMTETGPTVFLVDAASAARKIGSVGRSQLLVTTQIIRSDGEEAQAGETGELWVKGPGITPGYWNRPEATAASFAPDGWLKTGDLAVCDDEGYHYIVGRSKEMYISGGENVYPAEVENVLAAHPDVLEAAIVGVTDERWGEVGLAYILPQPGGVPDTDDLTRFCRDRLAAYKVPKKFIIVSEFPRTAAGKVQKHLLPDADD